MPSAILLAKPSTFTFMSFNRAPSTDPRLGNWNIHGHYLTTHEYNTVTTSTWDVRSEFFVLKQKTDCFRTKEPTILSGSYKAPNGTVTDIISGMTKISPETWYPTSWSCLFSIEDWRSIALPSSLLTATIGNSILRHVSLFPLCRIVIVSQLQPIA